jgi:hypothetical protein
MNQDVTDVRKSLIEIAFKLPPNDLLLLCETDDQKDHYYDMKLSFCYLAIAFYDNGRELLKECLKSRKEQEIILSLARRYLSFYQLIESIWKSIHFYTENPCLIEAVNPDGSVVEHINFPFSSALEVTQELMSHESIYAIKLSLSDYAKFSGSNLDYLYRLDHDLRLGLKQDRKNNYHYKLGHLRRGLEPYFSLREFCIRVAKKEAEKDREAKQILERYNGDEKDLDEKIQAGRRNKKGFGFVNGRKAYPQKGGTWAYPQDK